MTRIRSTIVSLLLVRCPSNIKGPPLIAALFALTARVITVVVDSIKCFIGLARTYTYEDIANEIWKLAPTLAYYYSSLSIFSFTSCFSCKPRSILSRMLFRKPIASAGDFALIASTTRFLTRLFFVKFFSELKKSGPATANTQPAVVYPSDYG